jgi:TRAP-type C4-dicarboxylate transport system permease small subunit
MGLMCLIVYSVFMRRVFNAPPLGVYDTAEVMLIPIVAFSLAYTGLTKGHIAVDLLSAICKPRTVQLSDMIILGASAILVVLLTWESALLFQRALDVNEVTQMVEIPYYPFLVMLTIGSAMFAIVLFRQAWQTFLGKEEEEMTGHE